MLALGTMGYVAAVDNLLLGLSHNQCPPPGYPVGKVPVCCAGGSGSIPGRTNTEGLKIIEEKVLPLL